MLFSLSGLLFIFPAIAANSNAHKASSNHGPSTSGTTSTTILPPCEPAQELIDTFTHLHFPSTLGKCALIGSGGALKGKHRGGEINSFDTVIRVNRVPSTPYHEDLGSKTDLFFSNSATDTYPGGQLGVSPEVIDRMPGFIDSLKEHLGCMGRRGNIVIDGWSQPSTSTTMTTTSQHRHKEYIVNAGARTLKEQREMLRGSPARAGAASHRTLLLGVLGALAAVGLPLAFVIRSRRASNRECGRSTDTDLDSGLHADSSDADSNE